MLVTWQGAPLESRPSTPTHASVVSILSVVTHATVESPSLHLCNTRHGSAETDLHLRELLRSARPGAATHAMCSGANPLTSRAGETAPSLL